jgi:hypothetical protein
MKIAKNMNHIKRYKIFESKSEIDDLIDMLSYLSDDMYNIQVNEGDHHAYENCIEITISKDGGKFYFWNEGNIGELTTFKISDINEYLLRINNYMNGEKWNIFNFDVITFNKINEISRKFRDNTYITSITLDKDNLGITSFNYKENKKSFIEIDKN